MAIFGVVANCLCLHVMSVNLFVNFPLQQTPWQCFILMHARQIKSETSILCSQFLKCVELQQFSSFNHKHSEKLIHTQRLLFSCKQFQVIIMLPVISDILLVMKCLVIEYLTSKICWNHYFLNIVKYMNENKDFGSAFNPNNNQIYMKMI